MPGHGIEGDKPSEAIIYDGPDENYISSFCLRFISYYVSIFIYNFGDIPSKIMHHQKNIAWEEKIEYKHRGKIGHSNSFFQVFSGFLTIHL